MHKWRILLEQSGAGEEDPQWGLFFIIEWGENRKSECLVVGMGWWGPGVGKNGWEGRDGYQGEMMKIIDGYLGTYK